MAPLPKRRHTKSRTGKRRSTIKLDLPNLSICKNCGSKKLSHVACPKCGKK